jgi:hypothetical protein
MQHLTSRTMGGMLALVLAGAATTALAENNYAEDRALIEDLQARYLFALDFRDPQAYANTFTVDGILDYGVGEIKGREAIAAMVANMRENAEAQRAADTSGLRPAAGRHNIANIVIDVQGDTATSVSYWFHMGNSNPDRSAQLNSFGHYEDELAKVNGEWLFSKRKIYNEQIAEWAAADAENPVVQPGDGPRMRAPAP